LENDWVVVYSAENMYKADIAIALLAEHGVQAVTMNKQDSAYLFGDVEIYVHRDLVVLAKHVLEANIN
jgi:Putative prokaryotic signal transducing protein